MEKISKRKKINIETWSLYLKILFIKIIFIINIAMNNSSSNIDVAVLNKLLGIPLDTPA